MFWPADEALRKQSWWTFLAWSGGPTWGQLVGALRPAIRAAWLLGWQVESIDVGIGVIHPGQTGLWNSIDRATLLYGTDVPMAGERQSASPTIRLGVMEIASLTGGISGTFAMPVAIPEFGTDEYDPDADTSDPDAPVPADLVAAVAAFVDQAVALLTFTPDYFDAPVAAQGLLWTFSSAYWRGLSPLTPTQLFPAMYEVTENTTDFLYGQLFDDRTLHADGAAGPANLRFLFELARQRALTSQGEWPPDHPIPPGGVAYIATAREAENETWTEMLATLQARGEAHRLRERPRSRLRGPDAPCWLDVLCELIALGVVLVDQLIEPAEPVAPIEQVSSTAGGGTVPSEDEDEDSEPVQRKVELAIWGGDGHVLLWRETVFDSEANEGLAGSVAWDYVPGDAQTRPMVVIVAGRGVAIAHDHAKVDGRPWDIEIIRVRDDSLMTTPGEQVSRMRLLAPIPIEPTPEEYFGPLNGKFPLLMARPKPNGLYLQYPTTGTAPDDIVGSTPGPIAPIVIELTVDPLSGRDAYAVDVHYFQWPIAGSWNGGVHICVWASPDVRIQTNKSEGYGAPVTGNPSYIADIPGSFAWIYSAEFRTATPASALPRPYRAYLAPTEAAASRFDLLRGPEPLSLEPTGLTLTPATHSYREYGHVDDLLLTLLTAIFDIAWSFIPVVGDVTDIGEALWIYRTGHDRWGRPMTDFERAMAYSCAAIPVVSGPFLRHVSELLVTLGKVTEAGVEQAARLFTRAGPRDLATAEDVGAALAAPGGLRAYRFPSPTEQQRAGDLVRGLALDDETVKALAEQLVAGQRAGWLTVGDLLSDAGDGFVVPALQAAFARHQRMHGNVSVDSFVRSVGG